jgi:hypothetical protein
MDVTRVPCGTNPDCYVSAEKRGEQFEGEKKEKPCEPKAGGVTSGGGCSVFCGVDLRRD